MENLANSHKKKLQSKYIDAVQREDGQIIKDEQKKRETIKEWCGKMDQKLERNESRLSTFDESGQVEDLTLDSLGGEITKEEVVYLTCMEEITELLVPVNNTGIKKGRLHSSFYEGIITLL